MRIIAAAVLTLTTLTACSNPSPGTDEASKQPTTGAAERATVENFAAIVAEHHADWNDQVTTTERNCLDPGLVAACSAGYITLGMQAETIRLSLNGAHKIGVPAYVGEPPAEIADLLAETETAAAAVKGAAAALQAAGCADPMDLKCGKQLVDLQIAIGDLSGKLDAWSVY